MGKFDVYKKKIELETPNGKDTFVLRPVSANKGGELFYVLKQVMSATNNVKGKSAEEQGRYVMEQLDDKSFSYLHKLIVLSLSKTYTNEKKEDIEEFVTQNFFTLLGPFLEVNLHQVKNNKQK